MQTRPYSGGGCTAVCRDFLRLHTQQSADISGKWKTSHNLSDSVNEVVNESKFAQGTENKFDAALYVDRICTIEKQSGNDYYTISAAPDMQKFEKDYKAYIDWYTAWMVEQFYLKKRPKRGPAGICRTF